jgi:hypothetical protein
VGSLLARKDSRFARHAVNYLIRLSRLFGARPGVRALCSREHQRAAAIVEVRRSARIPKLSLEFPRYAGIS